MKKNNVFSAILIASVLFTSSKVQSDISWKTESGFADSSKESQLLYFFLDNASAVKELEEDVLPDERIAGYINDQFVPVRINARGSQGQVLSHKFGVYIVPTLIILEDGKESRRLTRDASRETVLAFLRGEQTENFSSQQIIPTSTGRPAVSETLARADDVYEDLSEQNLNILSGEISLSDSNYGFTVDTARPASVENLTRYFFLVDTDNSASTGFRTGDFAGGDYLVQGAQVHRFTGADPDSWNWSQVGTCDYNISGSSLSYSVGSSVFDNPPIRAFAITQDDTFNNYDTLIIQGDNGIQEPAAHQFKKPVANTQPVAKTAGEIFLNAPTRNSIEGRFDLTNVWFASSNDSIEVALKFREDPYESGIHLFLDTDNNSQTGYLSHDKAGADFMVEGTSLFRFSGSSPDEWAWSPVTAELNVRNISDGIRFSIPKSRASIRENQSIGFWFSMTDNEWNEADIYPLSGMGEFFVGSAQ